MFISGLRSLISLLLRFSRVSSLQLESAEISRRPMPLRSSSVTSDLKVAPPKLISCTSSCAASLWMAQLGSALESVSSWLSVMAMPLMLRLVRFVRLHSGVRSVIGLLSRYRVRRFVSCVSGWILLILLPLRFSVVSPPRAVSFEISYSEFPDTDRLSSA